MWMLVGGVTAQCGKQLLTSLECCSPFLWELAESDSLCAADTQWLHPGEVMTTILQGTKEYDRSLLSAMTRGDMTGTDGTVAVSGASLNIKTMVLDLEQRRPVCSIRCSTTRIAFRYLPTHNHRSIVGSLMQTEEVSAFSFFLACWY